MEVLFYNELDITHLEKQCEKILASIKRDDFKSAEVKKLAGTPYYRAKLNQADRLLFTVTTHEDKAYALILEVIRNHAYEKSRFLNGASIDEAKIEREAEIVSFDKESVDLLRHLNPRQRTFHVLDKIISFDETQDELFLLNPPVVIIGSAGSGKTVLTLEKMKRCVGEVLYITGSPYLVQSARNLYYANRYSNDNQSIDFLSYREFLETLRVPAGKEVDFPIFSAWLRNVNKNKLFTDANKLYEEFKGVLTGNTIDKAYLTRTDYVELGVKQSIYATEERGAIYDLFERYLQFLKDKKHFDSNLVSYEYLSVCKSKYDFVVIDEVQDFTPVQLALIIKALKYPAQFIFCGDSNQIVHPNFFSWAKIKTLFYQQQPGHHSELIRILNKNYRNAPAITDLANKLLKAKTARFGSIDKESHYLVESQSKSLGEVYCLLNSELIRKNINEKTCLSARFAVVVLRDEDKKEASRHFQTPLIFSIHEAKGLEYDNVILYNFISDEEKHFREIVAGVTSEDLEKELVYGRIRDKTDRSLEIYKFYINALYVAITRAVQSVYLIENISRHPLLDLLGLKPTTNMVALDVQKSSLDEWQKEANRLQMQGKQEQANAIRSHVLHQQTPPWQVVTLCALEDLCEKAKEIDKKGREVRLLLFEYASVYQQSALMSFLARLNFAPALRPNKKNDILDMKYFMGYRSSNPSGILRQIAQYGVDFRNPFNQTPLMLACHFGNSSLVQQLIEKGASAHLTDNMGRNAYQIALQKALSDKKFAEQKLAPLVVNLSLSSMELLTENRLIKIDVGRMEFFLIHAMIALSGNRSSDDRVVAFNVDAFLAPLSHFPEVIMPEKRKRRPYISSILSKNEVAKQDSCNRKLFLRAKRGYYVLNPDLMLRINDEWVNLYTLLNMDCARARILKAMQASPFPHSLPLSIDS